MKFLLDFKSIRMSPTGCKISYEILKVETSSHHVLKLSLSGKSLLCQVYSDTYIYLSFICQLAKNLPGTLEQYFCYVSHPPPFPPQNGIELSLFDF